MPPGCTAVPAARPARPARRRGRKERPLHDAHVKAWLDYCNNLAKQWRHLAEWWIGRRWGDAVHDNYRDELLAAARLGIVRASRKFDPAQGAVFSTYATVWMRKEIGEYLTSQTQTIRVPCGADNREEHVERVRCMSLDRWRASDRGEEGGGDYRRHNTNPADRRDTCDARRAELMEQVELGMRGLNERLCDVIRWRYIDRMTLEQVGRVMGITRERVRQLECQALAAMREAIESHGEEG